MIKIQYLVWDRFILRILFLFLSFPSEYRSTPVMTFNQKGTSALSRHPNAAESIHICF